MQANGTKGAGGELRARSRGERTKLVVRRGSIILRARGGTLTEI